MIFILFGGTISNEYGISISGSIQNKFTVDIIDFFKLVA